MDPCKSWEVLVSGCPPFLLPHLVANFAKFCPASCRQIIMHEKCSMDNFDIKRMVKTHAIEIVFKFFENLSANQTKMA